MNTIPLLRAFSIRQRMQGAIVVVLAMFLLMSAAALWGGRQLAALNEDFMVHSLAETRGLNEVNSAMAEVRRLEKDMIIAYEEPYKVVEYRLAWDQAIERVKAAFTALLEGEEDDDNIVARAALEELGAYVQATDPVLRQIAAAGFDTAKVADQRMGRAKEIIAKVETRVQEIAKIVEREADDRRAEFQGVMQEIFIAFVAVLAVVVTVIIPTTLANSRSMVGPIQEAREAAQAIAGGDLTQAIRPTGRDELTELLVALQAMQQSLRRTVGSVRAGSDGLRIASIEIAGGNQDLSLRTEQTASNLQQTASSMEQLTSTVQQSADSARHAMEMAASAADVAGKGGQVVSQVVSTMDEITRSAKRIGDIIGTIDGIAFQTNILALNAAVEAARAGEQGRGFAVVAAEVRGLAGRSASAAREIKTLVGASIDRVEAGSRLVANAGQTMEEIVGSVQRVANIINEITTASSEQSDGIGQINHAVSQLDQMTQQNAALVEQSAAAAESLRDQADRLAQVVGNFRIEAGAEDFSSAAEGR